MSQKNKKQVALGTDSPINSKSNAPQVARSSAKNRASSTKKDSKKDGRKRRKRSKDDSMSSSSSSSQASSSSGDGSASRNSASGSESESEGSLPMTSQQPIKSRANNTTTSSKPSVSTPSSPALAAQAFSDHIPMSEAEFTLNIDGSLNSIKSNANDQGHLVLILGQGISADKITPHIRDKIQSNLKINSKSDILKSPDKARTNTHVIHDVVLEGSHSGFPASLRIELPSFVASSSESCYVNSAGQPVNHLTFTLMPGETRSNKTILKNVCSRENLDIYNQYQNFNPHNLRENVHKAISADGIERFLVPHSKEARHPVVDLARSKMARENKLSKKQLSTYKKTGNLPESLMSESRDHSGFVLMSQALYDEYEKRVIAGMSASTPLSDVAHPYALVSRVGGDELQYADGIASANRMESKKDIWTNSREIFANRSNAEAKKNVTDTEFKAWARIKVRFTETKDLTNNFAN